MDDLPSATLFVIDAVLAALVIVAGVVVIFLTILARFGRVTDN